MDCIDREAYVTACKHSSEEIRALRRTHDEYHEAHKAWLHRKWPAPGEDDLGDMPEPPANFIDSGLHRYVYGLACGKHVLKIDNGAVQNSDELDKFKQLDRHARTMVACIEAYSNDEELLVMVRCEPLDEDERAEWENSPYNSGEDDEEDDSEMAMFWRETNKLDLDGDLHAGNIGRLNGKLVVLDYAM